MWAAILGLKKPQQNSNPIMTLVQSKILYQPGRRLAIQGPRKNTGQPVSCDKFSRVDQLNILQINISGLSTKIVELMKILHDEHIHVALVEETILPRDLRQPNGQALSTTGYTSY